MLLSQDYKADENGIVDFSQRMESLMNIHLEKKETDSVIFYISSDKEVYIVDSALNQSFENAGFIESDGWYKQAIAVRTQTRLAPLESGASQRIFKIFYSRASLFQVFWHCSLHSLDSWHTYACKSYQQQLCLCPAIRFSDMYHLNLSKNRERLTCYSSKFPVYSQLSNSRL
jgi:hypothetical protein